MDNHKFQQANQPQQKLSNLSNQASASQGRNFSSVEELLSFDREQNPVPPAVAERVNESLAAEPARPKTSWWQKLFGKS